MRLKMKCKILAINLFEYRFIFFYFEIETKFKEFFFGRKKLLKRVEEFMYILAVIYFKLSINQSIIFDLDHLDRI